MLNVIIESIESILCNSTQRDSTFQLREKDAEKYGQLSVDLLEEERDLAAQ
jgi:hypothetical protein